MTECENPYRHFPQKSLPPEPVWKEGFEKGQQNPYPKQYANKEELEKEIMKLPGESLGDIVDIFRADILVGRTHVIKLIRTHGLEE